MIFDSTMLAALAAQLRPLRGERLRDIWQGSGMPQADAISGDAAADDERAVHLSFRSATLLIDTHPQRSRLHFVERAAPATNTTLTTTLRKALRNARLIDVIQPDFDRVLRLEWDTRNAIGDLERFTLVAELMERRSNIVLLEADGTIVDALKRLPPFLNRARTILPHRPYEAPPSDKANPLEVQDWPARVLEAALPSHATAADHVSWLRAHFTGVSPVVARALQSTLHHTEPVAATHFAIACAAFFHNVKKAASEEITPALCGEQPYPFAFAHDCAPQQSTFSALIEQCVQREAAAQILAGFRARLLAHLASGLKRNAAQQQDAAKALRHAEDAALYNAQGQAIWAHIPQVEEALQHGATSIELPLDAWTTEDANTAGTTHIALEPKWSAADNATRCFNRYRRAQKLATDAPARVQELADEAARLHAWEEAARAAAQREELEAIARASGLYDKTQQREDKTVSRTRQESEAARPENKLRRREFEGWQFYMGRNALENQMLLSKVASPSDVWMHVRGMASAHVLIKNQKGRQPPPRVLEEAAAWLAATTRTGSGRATARGDSATRDGGPRDSAARDASTRRQASEHATDAGERLEIIYTQAKWVRAVRGAPGRVTLQRFETLLVQV